MLAPDGRDVPPGDSHNGDEVPDAGVLMCYYQPKIEASDESVHSVEALVRWRHPARGLLLPDQFLPAAEHAGLMRPVAALVLDMALAQIRSWRDQGITLTVAVNLSTTNLLDLGVVETIARVVANPRPARGVADPGDHRKHTDDRFAAGSRYGGRPATARYPSLA